MRKTQSTQADQLLSKVTEIARLAAELPGHADVVIEWNEARPDLLLFIALQRGGRLRELACEDEAEWVTKGVTLRARKKRPGPPKRPYLKLVKPEP